MPLDVNRHPCFCEDAKGTFGRVHLPVAGRCNIQCNFCDRKHDCLNESRPGVTSQVLTPGQALWYLRRVVERAPNTSVAGIAGPGDAFATPDDTLETLRMIRSEFPEMLLCVASNGLNVAPYVGQMAALDVSHVTLTINAVDPQIGQHVYAWVRPHKRPYRGLEAAKVLLANQLAALDALAPTGILVKVNTIIIPGVNDHHVEEVAAAVTDRGADLLNCMPMVQVPGTPLGDTAPPSCGQLAEIRAAAERYLPQMRHCTRCRADAAGMLGEVFTDRNARDLAEAAAQPIRPDQDRPNVAVASHEGLLVNEHLGRVRTLMVFAPNDAGGFELLEHRPTPQAGGGGQRWAQMGEAFADCQAILAAGAGETPIRALARTGLRVLPAEGLIDELLAELAAHGAVKAPLRDTGCAACSGDGTGCG